MSLSGQEAKQARAQETHWVHSSIQGWTNQAMALTPTNPPCHGLSLLVWNPTDNKRWGMITRSACIARATESGRPVQCAWQPCSLQVYQPTSTPVCFFKVQRHEQKLKKGSQALLSLGEHLRLWLPKTTKDSPPIFPCPCPLLLVFSRLQPLGTGLGF